MKPTPLLFRLAAVALSFGLMGAYVWYKAGGSQRPDDTANSPTAPTLPQTVVVPEQEPTKTKPLGGSKFVVVDVDTPVDDASKFFTDYYYERARSTPFPVSVNSNPANSQPNKPDPALPPAKKKRLVVLPGSKSAALIEVDDNEPLPATEQEVIEHVVQSDELKKQIQRLRQDYVRAYIPLVVEEETEKEQGPAQHQQKEKVPQRTVLFPGAKSDTVWIPSE